MAVSTVEAAGGFFQEQIALHSEELGVVVTPERTHPIILSAIEKVVAASLYVRRTAFNDDITGWGDRLMYPIVAYGAAKVLLYISGQGPY